MINKEPIVKKMQNSAVKKSLILKQLGELEKVEVCSFQYDGQTQPSSFWKKKWSIQLLEDENK